MQAETHRSSLTAILAMLSLSTMAHAGGVTAEIGWDDLVARLGLGNIPTGAGVVVGQVEALDGGSYGPNQAHPEFVGNTFTAMSGPPGNSGHATLVGQYFYGSTTSVSPDVNTIYMYEAGGWAQNNYLRTEAPGTTPPNATPGGIKIFNNSWTGSFGVIATDTECIRRADHVVDRDELIIINGVNNGGANSPLLAYMFNGVSVGLTNGLHAHGLTPAGYDGPGRMKPEIVAPNSLTSFAAPIVDSVTALLVETAATHPALSSNPNAMRSEVLKAALLGGATHWTTWTNNPATSGPNRGITSTPIDPTFGSGVVNVNRSHLMLTGAETDGMTTIPTSANADWSGWDLVTMPANSSRYYRFDVNSFADKVSILATWHRNAPVPFSSYTLPNFNLVLWRVDAQDQLIALTGDAGLPYFAGGNVVSQSSVDNVEHLHILGLQPGEYVLDVQRTSDLVTGSRDVAIAWLFPTPTNVPGDATGDGLVNIDDVFAVISVWGPCPGCPADLDGDGDVDIDDLFEVIANYD